MDERVTEIITVQLPDGKQVQVEATIAGGEEPVAVGIPSFEGVTDAIEGISRAIVNTMHKIKPRKATVEFSLEISLESGQLTALIVKGSGKGSLNITLEWGE